ncbi:GNAT family N-acetyltransferase [Nocardiopsis gilva YIM 90087]|uniref:GNAT family N-acetyltransferase n=1 Tax=Nocardiopsis gilva YIM 90087 TaxID=1235441 RepID=A0A223SAV9_9ACTN|nr:GNAT family N-acetyltransferase [Nocardiopsis gilva]ASU85216.1 GNAT family N-acetyltransferase [Nocardiopsis gilva YIM 90087]
MNEADDILIDRLAVRAWPAMVVRETRGWLLRATPGVSRRRSNSAVPPEHGALDGLADVEAFYAERNQPALIQVSPGHRLRMLDGHLAARGFERVAPSLVMWTPLDRMAEGIHGAGKMTSWRVDLAQRDDEWTRTLQAVDGRVDDAGEMVMDRIPGRTVFARVADGGTVAGVGAGVVDGGWLGIFCMGTRPEYRRSGVGTAILDSLRVWALRKDVRHAWLQVEERNLHARALYEAHGFAVSHAYHYRQLPHA